MLGHVKESMQMVESSLMEKEQVRSGVVLGGVWCWEGCGIGSGVVLGVVRCWEWCSVGSGVVWGVV